MAKINRRFCLIVYYVIGIKVSEKLFGNNLRRLLLKIILKKSGENVDVYCNVYFGNGRNLSIGNNSLIGPESRIIGGEVCIGNDVQIGPRTMILTGNHNFQDKNIPIRSQGSISKSVKINDNVWIGANVTILPGVIISEGVIVGAGAVVTKNIEPYFIVAGNPAKKIGYRGKE